jgi:hypothetical protein
VTTGIKKSCKKREICKQYRDNSDVNLKLYYKGYCKILTKVIITAKWSYYDNIFTKSQNKIKTIWEIVKIETSNSELNKGMEVIQDDNITKTILNQYLIDLINSFYQ